MSEPKVSEATEADHARPREGQAGVAPEPTLIARMLTHPIRVGILERLSNGDAAAPEIGEAIGVLPTHVRYHLNKLAEVGWIEVVRREKARGSDRLVFGLLFTQWLEQAPEAARGSRAAVGSTSPATPPCAPVELPVATEIAIPMDQMAQQRVSEVLGSALDQLKEVRAESRERLEGGGQSSAPAIFVRVMADEIKSADESVF